MSDPESISNLANKAWSVRELVPFIAAIVIGAVGGCTALTVHAVHGKREIVMAHIIAYGMVGAFGAAIAFAALLVFSPLLIDGWAKLLLLSCVSGLVAPISLLGTNVTMRFILRKIGLEVVVAIKRNGG